MLALVLLVCLLWAGQAQATTIVNESELRGVKQYRKWIARSTGTVPLPRRIRIIEGTPCGPGGCAFPRRTPPAVAIDYTPYLWEPGYESRAAEYDRERHLEHTIFIHELGHIWDLERGARRDRNLGYRDDFRRALGLSLAPRWLSRQRLYEGFADSYAFCVTGGTVYGYRTNPRICRQLRRLA